MLATSAACSDWIDAKTGHRVRRVTPDGGGKPYFYKNMFLPGRDGRADRMVISTPAGITLVDLAT